MLRRTVLLAILASLSLLAPSLSAHDDYRIIGTVARVVGQSLDVKQSKDGRVIAMTMDSATIVTRDKKTVARTELKAGLHVVVDASGDSIDDLVVLEVRLVPPPKS